MKNDEIDVEEFRLSDKQRARWQAAQEPSNTSALTRAEVLVYGSRRDTYGPPSVNHERTAALWSAYLGTRVTARDVCWLNVLQKLSRDRHEPNVDTEVDVAGYAENAHLVRRGM